MANTKPADEIRIGRIKATIWANGTENEPRYNVTFSRLYKDGDSWNPPTASVETTSWCWQRSRIKRIAGSSNCPGMNPSTRKTWKKANAAGGSRARRGRAPSPSRSIGFRRLQFPPTRQQRGERPGRVSDALASGEEWLFL